MVRRAKIAIGAALLLPVILVSVKPTTFDLTPRPYFAPQPGYKPMKDLLSWPPSSPEFSYFVEDGFRFIGSRSPEESGFIRGQVDRDRAAWSGWRERLGLVLVLEVCLLWVAGALWFVFRLFDRRHG
ncbi:hypothetical protein QA645_19520 [Bradyrhizobium sp. CIAT3101]|uniref:hypothetical protein n=1 Tax=Bradyrhizobium sp. CIAT3101 TaxID=439387 RepID=UPI0024B212B6|nr:hypothetical protein [Bradyrhizobium sp. CIAT3101]WFU84846.1 hypothetical protein QA645_19520 [Bradyrhizobium sp. CIAT3101]